MSAPNKRLIPLLGLPPFKSPATLPSPPADMVHPLAPVVSPAMGDDWQRWIAELWRATVPLLGIAKDFPVTFNKVNYPWRSALRISLVQAALGTLEAALGADDAGLLVCITDYNHVLEWNGTKFQWGPGELGSGFEMSFPIAPTSSGWHLEDGSVVSYLNADGSLTPGYALPTNAGIYFRL